MAYYNIKVHLKTDIPNIGTEHNINTIQYDDVYNFLKRNERGFAVTGSFGLIGIPNDQVIYSHVTSSTGSLPTPTYQTIFDSNVV